MTRHTTTLTLAAFGTLFACSNDTTVFGNDGGASAGGDQGGSTSSNNGGSTNSNNGGGPSTGGSPSTGGMGGIGGAPGGCMNPGPNDDSDLDGFTPTSGDCDDCESLVNPNAVEIAGNAADEDCDGNLDNALMPCDQAIVLDASDAVTVAGALELCKPSTGLDDWGVASAAWVQADGSAPPAAAAENAGFHLGHGVMPDFGPNVGPLAGNTMLVLSNGTARRPLDAGYQLVTAGGKNYQSPLPAGFPKDAQSCGSMTSGPARDSVALEVTIRTPSNATGFSFHFDFYAADYPGFVCSAYDDQFATLVSPVPMGLADENVTFNAAGEIFSVNGSIFDVCGCTTPPCMAGGKTFACTQGTMALMGNGFGNDQVMGDRGATGWQLTTVPCEPSSEIVVRWATWDMTDAIFTASALVDDFQWTTDPNVIVETVPDP